MTKRYDKQPTTLDEQIVLLRERNVSIENEADARVVLKNVSYYRLSAYFYPFREKNNSNKYIDKCTFSVVWSYYLFDRQLRCLLIDAIERVEIATKCLITNHFAHKYGVFGYNDIDNFAKNIDRGKFDRLISFINTETNKSTEEFVRHFKSHYDTVDGLPIWMAFEVMTFGNMFTFFKLMKKQDKSAIAKELGCNEKVFDSWLNTLNYVRNICAHHGRVWNRHLAVNPVIPCKDAKWQEQYFPVNETRIYSVLCILKTLLNKIAPNSQWANRFKLLLKDYPSIHTISMGIPEKFEMSKIWSDLN